MSKQITIALAGDVMLGRLVNDSIKRRGHAHPWGNMTRSLKEADLFMINLECALTAHSHPWQDGLAKPFNFRADPEVLRTLELGSVDFVSLANNHAGDFGDEGLIETLHLLDSAAIAHSGAGADQEAASTPARFYFHAVRVSVISFADYPKEWAAMDSSPGINYTPVSVDPADFRKVRDAIAEAKNGADFVIFSIHWGPNMNERPSRGFREFARAVIDAGADVFWGHSAHVVQGVEIWHGKPILYDTGDFVDDYAVDSQLRNDLGALFRMRLRDHKVESLEVVPVKIDNMQVNRATGAERTWFLRRFERLCHEMGTEVATSDEESKVLMSRERTARV
jgi:poly-gamma-glutamate synthesis protein (capsule biosynthesis protein)